MNDFWANVVSKAVGREWKLPPPSIRQEPAEPARRVNADDYMAKARESMPAQQHYLSADERFGGTVEYTRPDGSKISVAGRDASDITLRHTDRTWNTNSRRVQTDKGLFEDTATPQERAAAHQLAARDGRYLSQGDGGIYGSMTPWQRAAMLSDAIQNGDFNLAGHGDGGAFSEA